MPNTGANAYPSRYRWLGLTGSFALACGGLTAGALPAAVTGPTLRASGGAGTTLAFAGLAVLTVAWLRLGRPADGQLPPGTRWMLVTLAWWAAPLLAIPPLFSRDVYSYLAQGAMLAGGLDVYTDGPAVLGGATAVQIPGVWQHTPTPYGPVFLLLARAAAPVAAHPYAGTLLLRLAAVLAVAALAGLLVALARHFGTDPASALRLGALNPLVLLHLIAGAHNDALLLALLAGGLLAAVHRRTLIAAALVTLAALVKAPAALALPVVWWLGAGTPTGHRPRAAQLLRTAGPVALAAAATTIAATAAAGTGYGWLAALTTPATTSSWSLTTSLGRTLSALSGTAPDPLVAAMRLLGLAAAVAITALACWLVARRGLEPVAALALALAALVALGPAFRPWYALWSIALIAAAVRIPAVRRIAGFVCAALAFTVMPDGFTPDAPELVLAIGGVAAGYSFIVLAERQITVEERQLAC
ncbi:polyprenol phosphomannose-dependent alpha 1,6 mannosyltransferase MptB [Kitasatospora sp. NPDC049285]|uniref:polyprenol phosphomannose-dependent alpha 1,6 mannosyltransferase MptB n=1 Tax=Kitasatospora sp. NPDC049285 TaxID=3157096 RepID=UPI003438D2D8